MGRSYVVTGGGRGVGRATAERLLGAENHVAIIELDPAALSWTEGLARLIPVVGSASDEAVTERAADLAQAAAPLGGWVNNAAVFRDAWLHEVPARAVLDLIALNFEPVVVGCATAVRRFLATGTGGAIVNVSSHQAQRAVAGALPYATAKAAIEGLTRALAVDYGPQGVRVNAVALGSVVTERLDAFLAQRSPLDVQRFQADMAALHPLGRAGQAAEVAAAIAHLLSDEASFITGAVVPVDGGRAAQGQDPEARRPAPDSGPQ